MNLIKSYQIFIKENLDQSKSIMQKKLDAYEKLKVLLSKNLGYIGKFTQYLMEENVPYPELEKLFRELVDLKSKNSAFDINGLKYEKVLDKIQATKEDNSIKSLIGQFPSEQKKIIRDLLSNQDRSYRAEEVRVALGKISQKDNQAFISKISRYKNSDELYSVIKIFSKDANDSKDQVLKEIEGKKSRVVYDRDNIFIVMILAYSDIKVLGSNTSWCIVRSETTYDKYVRGRYQFIVYNYSLDSCDPDFKIGFTLNKDLSIYAAHNILDFGASKKLQDLFKSNNISFQSLFPKKDPLVYDLDKITSRTVNGIIDQICDECKMEEIPKVIQKIFSLTGKSNSFILSCIKKLCNRYFSDEKYVYQTEIDKIDKRLFEIVSQNRIDGFTPKIIFKEYNEDVFNRSINEERISLQIDFWSDKEICRIKNDVFELLYCVRYVRSITQLTPRVSIDLIKKISDRMNQAYKNSGSVKDTENKKLTPSHFGFKLLKSTELSMLLFNASLGRKESTPDYINIIKHISEYDKCRYVSILKLPIDLDSAHVGRYLTDEAIKYIIKKDYKQALPLDKDNYEQCIKLIDHLSGYKILFHIRSKDLKEQYGYKKDDIINRIIKKFRITRLIDKTINTEGDVSIQVLTG